MYDDGNHSRSTKFEKRRKNTKRLTFMIVAAVILIIVLIIVMLFSGGSGDKEETKTPPPKQVEQPEDKNDNEDTDSYEKSTDETEDNKSDESNVEDDQTTEDSSGKIKTERVESSDDNVAEAFTGNWEPIGTSQTDAHTINLDEGTADRNEIEEAVTVATGIDSMTVWWLSRAADDQVEATISNKADQSEIYRVHLQWVDEKGWKPTKVEMLKENDKK